MKAFHTNFSTSWYLKSHSNFVIVVYKVKTNSMDLMNLLEELNFKRTVLTKLMKSVIRTLVVMEKTTKEKMLLVLLVEIQFQG